MIRNFLMNMSQLITLFSCKAERYTVKKKQLSLFSSQSSNKGLKEASATQVYDKPFWQP